MTTATTKISAKPSHLIVHVSNTDDTIAFYQALFDAPVERDHTFSAPSLDAIFGRKGVVIRSTFIDVGGYRLHTIETMDAPRPRPPEDVGRQKIGITGLSLEVAGLEALRERAAQAGLAPTEIYNFKTEHMDTRSRMFFVNDPDGTRLELIEYG